MSQIKKVESIRTKLGYSSETKEKLKPLSLDEILTQSTKLNEAPIEKIQELINKRIVDIQIIPKGNNNQCMSNKKTCRTTEIEFQIMFESIIVGFRSWGGNGRALTTHSNSFLTRFNTHFHIENFARRANYMYLSVIYTHHTKGHKTNYSYNPFRYKFDRSPFNMNLLPHVRSQYERGIYLMKHLDLVWEYSKKKPTIENHLEFRKNYNFERIHIQHSKDNICDCEQEKDEDGYQCENNFHTQEEYCDKYCRKKDILTNYISHPQYYHHSENYCAGSIQTNLDGKQAMETRNVFQFINNLINGIQEVNSGDSRDGFEIYYNVFVNGWLIFNENTTYPLIKRIYDDLYENSDYEIISRELLKRMMGSSDHILSAKCYCLNCVCFRVALDYNVKFNKDLLVLSDSVLVTEDEFKSILEVIKEDNWNWHDNTYLSARWGGTPMFNRNRMESLSDIWDKILSINPFDKKYHVFVSKFDLRHVVFQGGYKSDQRIKFFDKTHGIPISARQSIVYSNLIKEWDDMKIKLANNRMILNKMNKSEDSNIDSILEIVNKVKLKGLKEISYKAYHPDQSDEDWNKIGDMMKTRA